mmetsp:Transcript_25824/g.65283  ORF Transcript_25824/g.65283 Transcript_25824/m.65283 type:complete len:328 (-) Transcript_25824:1759-2742(-)
MSEEESRKENVGEAPLDIGAELPNIGKKTILSSITGSDEQKIRPFLLPAARAGDASVFPVEEGEEEEDLAGISAAQTSCSICVGFTTYRRRFGAALGVTTCHGVDLTYAFSPETIQSVREKGEKQSSTKPEEVLSMDCYGASVHLGVDALSGKPPTCYGQGFFYTVDMYTRHTQAREAQLKETLKAFSHQLKKKQFEEAQKEREKMKQPSEPLNLQVEEGEENKERGKESIEGEAESDEKKISMPNARQQQGNKEEEKSSEEQWKEFGEHFKDVNVRLFTKMGSVLDPAQLPGLAAKIVTSAPAYAYSFATAWWVLYKHWFGGDEKK